MWLFTRGFGFQWTNDSSERAVEPPKRHEAVSGYWHDLAALARWCRVPGYLASAVNHGLTVLGAITITIAIEGSPGYRHSTPSPDTAKCGDP